MGGWGGVTLRYSPRVGLGWRAPLVMSACTSGVGQGGLAGPKHGTGEAAKISAIRWTLYRLLTISTQTGGLCYTTPAGLSHMVGVCFVEMSIMARGGKAGKDDQPAPGMPRFVDVKLTQEQRQAFVGVDLSAAELVDRVQQLVFEGYRFGCSWSGENQTYTASMTCREPSSPNNGLCMTSFGRTLHTALRLAVFKHEVVCGGVWVVGVPGTAEDFG